MKKIGEYFKQNREKSVFTGTITPLNPPLFNYSIIQLFSYSP